LYGYVIDNLLLGCWWRD